MSQYAIACRYKHQPERFVGDESLIKIAQANVSLRYAVVDVDAGESIAIDSFEVGVEIHPLSTQRCKSILVPKETREPLELMSRIDAVEQPLVNVAGSSTTHEIAGRGN